MTKAMSNPKSPKRSARKPSQLDRINEQIAKSMNAVHQDMVDRFEAFNRRTIRIETRCKQMEERLLDDIRQVERKLDLLLSANKLKAKVNAIKEPGVWVPEVGDLVFITRPANNGEKDLVGTVATVTIYFESDGSIGVAESMFWFHSTSFRRPSAAEIAAHQEQEKWKGITELQTGDACDTTGVQQAELFGLWIGPTSTPAPSSTRMWYYKTSKEEKLCGLSLKPGEEKGSDVRQWLPFPEFKRRLLGTIEAKRREEEARPLEFGTPVKLMGKEYRIACNAPDANGYYLLTQDEIAPYTGFKTRECRRREFTVVQPTKP